MRLMMTTLSPYARKCWAAVIELGLLDRVELVKLPPRMPTETKPDLEAVNPLSKIPALETADGPIVDSRVIVPYLDSLGGGALYPAGAEGWRVRTIEAMADGMCDAGVVVRLESIRPEAEQRPAEIGAYRRKITDTLDWLEGHLPVSDRFDAGVLALVAAIDWFSFRAIVPGPLEGRPRLADFHARWAERPCLRDTRPA